MISTPRSVQSDMPGIVYRDSRYGPPSLQIQQQATSVVRISNNFGAALIMPKLSSGKFYAFPPVQILSSLLHKIEQERKVVILIAPD